jgi:hypothetical protein
LAKNIDNFAKADGGMIREFLIRTAICADQFWYPGTSSRWKLHLMHEWSEKVRDSSGNLVEPDDYNYWRNRVMNLCSYEMTHQNFGLGYNDLMKLDVATFEEIEEAIQEHAKRTKANLDALSKHTNSNSNNLLEGIK